MPAFQPLTVARTCTIHARVSRITRARIHPQAQPLALAVNSARSCPHPLAANRSCSHAPASARARSQLTTTALAPAPSRICSHSRQHPRGLLLAVSRVRSRRSHWQSSTLADARVLYGTHTYVSAYPDSPVFSHLCLHICPVFSCSSFCIWPGGSR